MTNSTVTNKAIENARNEYATEDMTLLLEHGSLAITDTVYGTLQLSFEGGEFTAFNNDGESFIKSSSREEMFDFIKACYTFTIEEEKEEIGYFSWSTKKEEIGFSFTVFKNIKFENSVKTIAIRRGVKKTRAQAKGAAQRNMRFFKHHLAKGNLDIIEEYSTYKAV